MHYPKISFSSSISLLLLILLASSYFRPEAIIVDHDAKGDIELRTANIKFFDLKNKTPLPPQKQDETFKTIVTKVENGPIVYMAVPRPVKTKNSDKANSNNAPNQEPFYSQSIYTKFPKIPEELKKEQKKVRIVAILEITPQGKVAKVILKTPSPYQQLNTLTIESLYQWLFATNATKNLTKEITLNLLVE
jgi:hypothetical protein